MKSSFLEWTQSFVAGNPDLNKGIFFDGLFYDAYAFVAESIKKANKDLILIDNFIDDSVLLFFQVLYLCGAKIASEVIVRLRLNLVLVIEDT